MLKFFLSPKLIKHYRRHASCCCVKRTATQNFIFFFVINVSGSCSNFGMNFVYKFGRRKKIYFLSVHRTTFLHLIKGGRVKIERGRSVVQTSILGSRSQNVEFHFIAQYTVNHLNKHWQYEQVRCVSHTFRTFDQT